MIVTCPLKDHGCKETEEMSREECIEHVASKEGIYPHLLIIANKLFLIRSLLISSIDAKEEDRRNYVESDRGYESLPKVRSASPKAIKRYVSTDGLDPSGNEFGFLEDGVDPNEPGSHFIYNSLERRLENEFYYTLSAKENALGPSQYYDEEQGQGHGRDDLTVTDLSPAGSLTVTFCPHCNSNILSSEPDNHKCIVTCPLKDHGCKETKEMSLEECIEHISSKTGIYSHFLMIARILSSIVPTGSTEAQERERGNYGEGDEGYDSLHQALSTSPTVARKPDGPDPGENELGFLEDGGAGADDEPMSLTTTLRA
ncbi:PREDICTED: uncharacterized protein LOC100637857 [Amphimedon queenslandica]|nr:PREDICTED: uncharacterized protein LOC100637857 [Amphimedon queenslandica]|eukprot:XP_019860048.1 PREDICTED: uncharacterized protein LOC100637857 [Amphimedon queenslandica]